MNLSCTIQEGNAKSVSTTKGSPLIALHGLDTTTPGDLQEILMKADLVRAVTEVVAAVKRALFRMLEVRPLHVRTAWPG